MKTTFFFPPTKDDKDAKPAAWNLKKLHQEFDALVS